MPDSTESEPALQEKPRKDRSVWHYTDAGGLDGIVSHNVLWATSHRFMNDAEESKYASTVLSSAADAARKSLDPTHTHRFDEMMRYAARSGLEAFLLCAARKSDLLTVWRGYGSAVPYAIELDATVDLLPVQQVDREDHPNPPDGWGREAIDTDEDGRPILGHDPDHVLIEIEKWAPVQYDTRTARKRVDRIASLAAGKSNPLSEHLVPWLNLGGIDLLQLKHPAFKDEREARMVFEVSPRWKFVKHRATRFGMTPYIEVSAADAENQRAIKDRFVTQPAKRLPIKSVQIGPSPLGDESIDALREFLEFNGYPDVPIRKSSTPFR